MKRIKWKILIITSIICLLPIAIGLYYYNELPSEIPIHFNINNEPDNYGLKEVVIIGLPIFMAMFQILCCVISDIYNVENKKYKLITVSKWIIPVITIVLYILTIGVALGNDLDIRRIIGVILGIIFILIGNYIPKIDQNIGFRIGFHLNNLYNSKLDEKSYIKISRINGYSFIGLGILMFISLFFEPIYTVGAILLMILVLIIITFYAFSLVKKNNKETKNN